MLQVPFVIVHLRVVVPPAVKPVTVLVFEVGVVIVTAVPLTKLHAPVPVVGALPAKVKLLVLH